MVWRTYGAALAMVAAMQLGGCSRDEGGRAQSAEQRFAHMDKVDIPVKDITVRAWVARSSSDVQSGLMHVTADEMQPYDDGARRGMFFYFDHVRSSNDGFWMLNVPIPLDIAFMQEDGTVVTVETMAPFDTRSTYSDGPYRFTLEVSGGLFKKLGLKAGDVISIPASILNSGD
ncbi:MAG TPA: DUF192 domain-containing protein [Phycisphaerae bacterium]|nr:DUF192 domain-containing protein [Phycisphaerales bacterium]HRX87151.1 DUF192 domain-containing protein [Phycisphaerae bacterium]